MSPGWCRTNGPILSAQPGSHGSMRTSPVPRAPWPSSPTALAPRSSCTGPPLAFRRGWPGRSLWRRPTVVRPTSGRTPSATALRPWCSTASPFPPRCCAAATTPASHSTGRRSLRRPGGRNARTWANPATWDMRTGWGSGRRCSWLLAHSWGGCLVTSDDAFSPCALPCLPVAGRIRDPGATRDRRFSMDPPGRR
jgi:hypothetical protein